MMTNFDLKQSALFTINAKTLYSTDILHVKKGEQYQFYCDKDQGWKDWFIPTGPNGYFNVLAWLIGLRLKSAKCFCLCGVYDQKDSTAFAIGSNNIIQMEKTGVVSFFANDTKGFYRNNSGCIKLRITRLQ